MSMGLFYSTPHKPTTLSDTTAFSGSKHVSSHELRSEVRRDLHDKLGRYKGEQVFEILDAHLDQKGISGKEIEGTLKMLRENHQDNIKSADLGHIEDVLRKHYHD